jgi:hypothetical protein
VSPSLSIEPSLNPTPKPSRSPTKLPSKHPTLKPTEATIIYKDVSIFHSVGLGTVHVHLKQIFISLCIGIVAAFAIVAYYGVTTSRLHNFHRRLNNDDDESSHSSSSSTRNIENFDGGCLDSDIINAIAGNRNDDPDSMDSEHDNRYSSHGVTGFFKKIIDAAPIKISLRSNSDDDGKSDRDVDYDVRKMISSIKSATEDSTDSDVINSPFINMSTRHTGERGHDNDNNSLYGGFRDSSDGL